MGNRRYLACKSLGWLEVPCIVIQSTPNEDNWFMLSENLQRDDLTDSEKGKAVQNLVTQSGSSLREVAKKLGIPFSNVQRWHQAAGYPEEVQQMTKDNQVSDYAISPIAILDTPQEQIKTAEHIRDHELNYRQARETVDIIKDMPEDIRRKLTDEPMK